MTNLVFRVSPHVILGSYSVARLGQFVLDWGTRYMVIMDPRLKAAGISAKVLQSLSERDVRYFIIDDLENGGETEVVRAALALSRKAHIQGVIAVGSTKAINIGRAVASLYHETHTVYDCIDDCVVTAKPLPLICVPTTMDDTFIFTEWVPLIDARSRCVKLLKTQKDLSKLILFDPDMSLPIVRNQIAAVSLETLCIAVEGLLSQKASFFSDMLVEKSLALLAAAPDSEAAEPSVTPQEVLLAQCSFLASLGAAISSPGAASLFALALSARFKISSAVATAILFPYIIEDAAGYKNERLDRVAKLLNLVDTDLPEKESAALLADNIRQRLTKANIPTHLKDLSLTMEQLALAAGDVGDFDLMNNLPHAMSADDLFNMVKQAY